MGTYPKRARSDEEIAQQEALTAALNCLQDASERWYALADDMLNLDALPVLAPTDPTDWSDRNDVEGTKHLREGAAEFSGELANTAFALAGRYRAARRELLEQIEALGIELD